MTVPLKARILLADDHALVRSGLRMVLNLEADLDVVAEASDGLQAIELALAQPLDLAILDVSMPGLTGPQAARQLRDHRPTCASCCSPCTTASNTSARHSPPAHPATS